MPKLYLSDQLDLLIKNLAIELSQDGYPPLHPRTILLPNQKLKQYLMLSLARLNQGQVIAGCRFFSVEKALYPNAPSSVELLSSIYQELGNIELPYPIHKTKKRLELAEHLASLFVSYKKFGRKIDSDHWQAKLFEKVFPPQTEFSLTGPIHCFGCDFLSEKDWEALSQKAPLSIYLFSPCFHFWEDVCTYWEKKKLVRKNEQLEPYLSEAPPLLANWGKLGRETLKIFDRFDFELEETYSEEEPRFALQVIRRNLLFYQKPEGKRVVDPEDRSIAFFQTGSSRLREIEILKENIVKLQIDYRDITVLAPNIDSYVPLIQFVFSDEIPYRIQDVEIGSQSHFLQGLHRLLKVDDSASMLSLFETPSFYSKFNWDLVKVRMWLEQGLDRTLQSLYLHDLEIEWSDADLLEEVVFVISELKKDLQVGEKTWGEWALFLEKIAKKYLVPDEIGSAAFENLLKELTTARIEGTFSIEFFRYFLQRPSSGAIHSSSLHAVRFASLQAGSILPTRALFLIGMDEEHFPRKEAPSSLDLLRREKGFIPRKRDTDRYLMLQALFAAKEYLYFSYGHLSPEEGKPIAPSLALQEILTDLDAHFINGNWIQTAPSLSVHSESKNLVDFFGLERPFPDLPTGEAIVILDDLAKLARHPWKFYLQKVLGIFLEQEPLSVFAAQRNWLAKEKVLTKQAHPEVLPPGLIGLAQKQEIEELSFEWEGQLKSWGIHLSVWSMLASCREKKEVSPELFEIPPIEVQVTEQLKVKIVGDLKTMSDQGFVTTSEEPLIVWPEALTAAMVSGSGQLFLLKKGKIEKIENPEEAMRSFLVYYFRALSHLPPLQSHHKGHFEDPVADWVLSRVSLPSEQEVLKKWGIHATV